MKKSIIIISSFLLIFCNIALFAKNKVTVTFLMFNTISKTSENIDFLDKKAPEILKVFLVKNSPENYLLELAWEKSLKYDKWQAKTEIAALENGKILKTDFVIYGDIILELNGYSVVLNLYNVKRKKLVYSLTSTSAQGETDLYSFLQSINEQFYPILSNEIEKYLESLVTFKKLASFEAGTGYPLPVSDFFTLQIGILSIEGGINFTSPWLHRNKYMKFYLRGGFKNGFDFFINHPQKITGYFYDLYITVPLSIIIQLDNKINLLFTAGYTSYFSFYNQIGVDSVSRIYFNHAPAITLSSDFEIPIKNSFIALGMKNRFDFIFYPGLTSHEVKPKIEYKPMFYTLFKMEKFK